jgi:hypothetical protein
MSTSMESGSMLASLSTLSFVGGLTIVGAMLSN